MVGNLLLLDVLRESPGFRFRHGTNLAGRACFDVTGKTMDDYPDPEYAKVALRSFSTVVETRRPLARLIERVIDDASMATRLCTCRCRRTARRSTCC
jgi:hypothetical protein